ncbi:MAG: hypothetical protein LAO77_15615 [Acidobacteriia bacterium]|nr:hypothetical protein [Terriglobia bacterium]
MSATVLKRENDRLYHETDGHEWHKRPNSLFLKLSNVRASLQFSIERGNAPVLASAESVEGNEKSAGVEKYSETLGWRITGTADLQQYDRIGIIKKDGTLAWEHDSLRFVVGTATDDRRPPDGALLHFSEEWMNEIGVFSDVAEVPLSLDVRMPASALKELAAELLAGRLDEIDVSVRVDVFESDIQHGLNAGHGHNYYYVEDGSMNAAHLEWFRGSHGLAGGGSSTRDSEKDEGQENANPESLVAKANLPEVFSNQTEALRRIADGIRNLQMVGVALVIALLLGLLLK